MFPQDQQFEGPKPTEVSEATGTNAEKTLEERPTAEAPKEISVVQEQPTTTQTPVQQDPVVDDNQPQAKPADENEIKEEFSGKVDAGETVWSKKAETVINQYGDEPYTEEEEAENLQVEYLDSRFGVKINKKEHK